VTTWRVVGGIVAAALVAGATVSAVSTFTEQRTANTTTYQQAIAKVVVETGTGDVEVREGRPGSGVVVERRTRSSWGTTPTASEAVAGDVLTLRGICRGFWSCSVEYRITVPPGTALEATTSTGSIAAAGLDAEVSVTSSTGSIELTGLRSQRVQVEASTGSIELGFTAVPSDVRVEASTGDVEVVVPRDGTKYAVQTSTSTGSTDVAVPVDSSSSRRIEARTSTGSVEVRAAP
jgi:hypothetical protein